ncbi:MAG: hypothetical protein UW24_C0014G0020 [Parcubacteria group bacterium GW2011_GWA2_44_12]|nr:MAG: hypothetical protein UW24_C0014G0020 [Parcubacteria group bacterium GW2011_GWA2_44_12]
MHWNTNNFLKFGGTAILLGVLILGIGAGVLPSVRSSKNAGAAAVTPFDLGWRYARSIPIYYSETASNLTEFQVKISVKTGNLATEEKLRTDCADLRFTDEDNAPLFYSFSGGKCNTALAEDTTDVWVKINTIPSNGTAIRMYYGNLTATADYQNLAEVFSYKEPKPVGYILNEREKKVQIVSLADDNMIVVDNAPQAVKRGGIVIAEHGGVIKASKLVSIDTTSGGAVVPLSWAGTAFEIVTDGNPSHHINFLFVALWGDAQINIPNSAECSVSNPIPVSSSPKLVECKNGGSSISIESTNSMPVLVAFKTVEQGMDYSPLYPKTSEQLYAVDITAHGDDGPNWATALPVSAFGTLFGSAVDTEYVGAISIDSTTCILTDEDAHSGPADTLISVSVTDPEFFSEIKGKWSMQCDGSPAYAVIKAKGGNAKNLWSEPFMRQFSFPMPAVGILGDEISKPAPPVPVLPPADPEVTCPDTYVPSNENQYVNVSNRLGWWYNQQFDADDEVISQYTYNVYLTPEQWFLDHSSADPDDPTLWEGTNSTFPAFQEDHLVCFWQPHEVSYGPSGNAYVDIPQQCFPIDYAQESLITAPPTIGQLAYIHLTKTQIENFIHAIQAAGDLENFLQPFVDATPIFNGSGIDLTDGEGVSFQEGQSDALGNIILTVTDLAPSSTIIHIPLEKKAVEKLVQLEEDGGNAQVRTSALANLSAIELTPFQLNDLYINQLTSGKLAFSPEQETAWNNLKTLQAEVIVADANYYWKIEITALNNIGTPTTVLCPQARPNSFHTISVTEIEQARTVSEPTEQFIYDGRVIANPPPGFIDTLSDLPIFQQSRGR